MSIYFVDFQFEHNVKTQRLLRTIEDLVYMAEGGLSYGYKNRPRPPGRYPSGRLLPGGLYSVLYRYKLGYLLQGDFNNLHHNLFNFNPLRDRAEASGYRCVGVWLHHKGSGKWNRSCQRG